MQRVDNKPKNILGGRGGGGRGGRNEDRGFTTVVGVRKVRIGIWIRVQNRLRFWCEIK